MIDLEIHDTFVECIDRSLDDYPKYKSANLFLLCVAADDRDSFDSITTWKREILKISYIKHFDFYDDFNTFLTPNSS